MIRKQTQTPKHWRTVHILKNYHDAKLKRFAKLIYHKSLVVNNEEIALGNFMNDKYIKKISLKTTALLTCAEALKTNTEICTAPWPDLTCRCNPLSLAYGVFEKKIYGRFANLLKQWNQKEVGLLSYLFKNQPTSTTHYECIRGQINGT